MRPRELLREIVVGLSRPSVLVRDGVALSHRDRDTVLDVYQQWLCLIVDLGYLTSVPDLRPLRRIWIDVIQMDVMVVLGGMSECLSHVINKTDYGFKARCATLSPHLYPLIREDFQKVIASNVFSAKRLIQLFSYASRLSLQDIDLTQQLEDEFIALEENISDTVSHPLLPVMINIVTRWMGSYVGEEIVPRHGPGGVAELGRAPLVDKYRQLGTDPRLEYTFGKPWWVESANKVDRMARVVFVAKSYKTQRVISMEPCTLQYFQQGVWQRIDDIVSSNRFLSSRISFHDQTRNQRLAQQGSIGRNYATIDLSSASDSVSYALVKALFRKTWLPRYILATRSTRTYLPSGRIVELKKFAPMGSALCFPIETIVFASICAAVAQRSRAPMDFSVYGDDIIVPTQLAEQTIEALSQFGFCVNSQKTYCDPSHWYRESCGAEFCDGFDVTPMRVSRKYAHKDSNVRIQKWISRANEAYDRGYSLLRQFYLMKIESTHLAPLFAPTFLKGDDYSNYHLDMKWDSSLQSVLVRPHFEMSRPIPTLEQEGVEEIRLRYWLESNYRRSSVMEPFIADIMGSRTSYRKVWVPHPDPCHDYARGRVGSPLLEYFQQRNLERA